MKVNNTCKLCCKTRELRESHIIPRSMIKLIRDETLSNRFYEVQNKLVRTIQDGPKEYLLCDDCEEQIGNYEKYFKESIHLSRHSIKITQTRDRAIFENLDYKRMKLFFLSILFRMSISSQEPFQSVPIADYTERIRQMILREEPGGSSDYSVSALIPLINEKMREEWATGAITRKNEQATYYDIVLGGVLYSISDGCQGSYLPDDLLRKCPDLLLNESGRWVMPLVDFYTVNWLRQFVDDHANEL